MSLLDKYYHAPDVEKSGFLVDQVYNEGQVEYMDFAYDGSPFNLYDHSGNVSKAVPLTARPPANETFVNFKGTVIPRDKAPNFYSARPMYRYY